MNRVIQSTFFICCGLTGCSSSGGSGAIASNAAEIALLGAAGIAIVAASIAIVVVVPVVIASGLVGSDAARDERAKVWQMEADPIYKEAIKQINSRSPKQEATLAWERDAIAYWSGNLPKLYFTGLVSKSEPESVSPVEIDEATWTSNRLSYSSDFELSNLAKILFDEFPGIAYSQPLRGVVYACYEETAARYRYIFNTQMAYLTNDYASTPDYNEDITMSIEQPCLQVELN